MRIRFNLVIVFSALVWVFAACTYDTIPEPVNCSELPILTIDLVENADCGVANGSITLSATNGLPPYTFLLEEVGANEEGLFENLVADIYTFLVTDSKGCTNTISAEVRNKNGMNISITSNNSNCQSNNGNITVVAEDGVEPYSFRINEQSPQNNGEFANLSLGEYAIVVADASGCEITRQVKILSDVVFAQVKTIITTNCAVSNCHDGSISPDLRNNQNIQSSASRIQSRTGARSMPPRNSGRSLTDNEIQEIACWVNDGANL